MGVFPFVFAAKFLIAITRRLTMYLWTRQWQFSRDCRGDDAVGVLGGCDRTCWWDRRDACRRRRRRHQLSLPADHHDVVPSRRRRRLRLPGCSSRTCHVLPGASAPPRLLPGDGRPPVLQSPGHAALRRRWPARSPTVRRQVHRSTAILIAVGLHDKLTYMLFTGHVDEWIAGVTSWCIGLTAAIVLSAHSTQQLTLTLTLNPGVITVFSARCNLYISRLCYEVNVRLSVHLSVTEVHLAHYS